MTGFHNIRTQFVRVIIVVPIVRNIIPSYSFSQLLWQGGCVDDFLSHLMCCCCAVVQEWREVEIRGAYGMSCA